ncbi:DUF6126 family protein [Streptomyces sp. NBC_01003]|uniref:DUF6126 family protein n=1 Tax=Streptomyces sp. NBC_01003 TaxID=2903714 RepID=UPI00386438F3|nr:DUF6126 family protein [Streptomyces sp. NBC_01003]
MSAETDDVTEPERQPARRDIEDKLPRGIWVRLLVYVFAGHLVAGFIYLLFTLGASRG